MKRFLIILLFMSMLPGCALFRNPTGNWDKAVAKADTAQKKIDLNAGKQVQESKGYVYGTQVALSLDPSTNKAHDVAVLLNDKAMLTLGPPDIYEANALREMVNNLISTNQALISKGKAELAEKDARVADLQAENQTLKVKLDKAQDKIVEVGTINAKFASSWTTLMKYIWYVFYFFIAAIVFKILAVVVPPPYNSIFGIVDFVIGGFIRFVFKLAPKAMETAKVVGSSYKTGLEHVITSIEDTKTKIEAKNEAEGKKSEGLTQLKTELKTNTDDITKKLITEVKQGLGYI